MNMSLLYILTAAMVSCGFSYPPGKDSETIVSDDNSGVQAYIVGPTIKYTPEPIWKVESYTENTSVSVADSWSDGILGQDGNIMIRKRYIEPVKRVSYSTANDIEYLGTVSYYDDMGYIKQRVERKSSSHQLDMITPYEHDFLGREDVVGYLPYPEPADSPFHNDGKFRPEASAEHKAWSSASYGTDYGTTRRIYEQAAGGRLLQSYQPGYTSYKSEFGYDVVSSEDKVLDITVNGETFVIAASYCGTGKLFKNTVVDEDGGRTEIFKDVMGKTVLERRYLSEGNVVQQLCADTYYVYDDLDRLTGVVSPEGASRMAPGQTLSFAESDILQEYGYLYEYDEKSRIAGKKQPGRGWEYMVYDSDRRTVMYQDANMRRADTCQWIRYDYDAWGRQTGNVLLTAGKNSSGKFASRDDWQKYYDTGGSKPAVTESATLITTGYDDQIALVTDEAGKIEVLPDKLVFVRNPNPDAVWAFGAVDTKKVFFDENNMIRKEFYIPDLGTALGDNYLYYYIPQEHYNLIQECVRYSGGAWGLTNNASLINSLDLPACLKGYIEKIEKIGWAYSGETVGTSADIFMFVPVTGIVDIDDVDPRNAGLKTFERIAVIEGDVVTGNYVERVHYYDRKGRVVQTVERDFMGLISRYSYRYDYVGNVISRVETHSPDPSIASDTARFDYTYDHCGRLLTENVTINGRSSGATVSYEYNDATGLVQTKVFGARDGASNVTETYSYDIRGRLTGQYSEVFEQTLRYDNPQYVSASHTGNIVEAYWRHKVTDTEDRRCLGYTYDALGRLVRGEGLEGSGVIGQIIDYDLNGNIERLQSQDGSSMVDNSYSYVGNRICKIISQEKTVGSSTVKNITADDFAYDANGNMTYHALYGLNLGYNYLNLLSSQRRSSGGSEARSWWLADGSCFMSSDRIYKGSFTYNWRGSSVPILSVAFSGGNVMSQAGRGPLLGNYYTITDHLGSVRVVFTNRNRIEAANDYQPFGARLECYGHHSSGGDYRFNIYRFNGKPYDLSLDDYGFLDYGARVYDSRLGRWLSPDPLAEEYGNVSPYSYCLGNPVRLVDPTGMFTIDENNAREDWYFNVWGDFLGQTETDTNNIRIIDDDVWYMWDDPALNVPQDALDDVLESSSNRFSEANISEGAALRIFEYFNFTGEPLITGAPGVMGVGTNNKGEIFLAVSVNNISSLMDSVDNVISTFEHEFGHLQDAYMDIKTFRSMSTAEKEERAILHQITSPSFQLTTDTYKLNTLSYNLKN